MTLDYDILGDLPIDLPLQDLLGAPTNTGHANHGAADVVVDDQDFPIDPQMVNNSPEVQDHQIIPGHGSSESEVSGDLADEECLATYRAMAPFCSWHSYDPKKPLHYLVKRFKSFVNDIATYNKTPFLHQYLYRDQTPSCILLCFMTATFYANRNKNNMPMVMQALHERALDLIDTEMGRAEVTPIQSLARTQALFVYQIMRLLDGDIILRSRSEKDSLLLAKRLDDLCKVRDNLECMTEPSVFTKTTAPEWHQWVFAESVRRTIVLGYTFITIYQVMNDPSGADDPGAWAHIHRWTLSHHLWEAASASDFERVWKDKPRFVISNYCLANFLENGRGEDVDRFAEILLSAYLGVDETANLVSVRSTPASSHGIDS
ncbi:hypothetical protein NW762_012409 [Fusarium torreyae]|uniref:Transcription factor domain-containing protein n=1 Tax=Fusarium torreyae TaxID=1237075 RepID=A0A9W8V8Q3_9HYPO|nr:hypothetical protein NW762_012409 [Fusarium torreyae]